MRAVLLLIMMIITTSIYGQVPDSIEVDLPWDNIYVASCDSDFGEGPTSSNEDVFISESEAIILYSADGECLKIIREWSIFVWPSTEIYKYVQVVNVNPELSLEAVDSKVVLLAELPISFSPNDFIINFEQDHVYSFDLYDETDNIIQFADVTFMSNLNVRIYDHTVQSVTNVNLFFTDCDQPVSIDLPTTKFIEFAGENFIDVTPEILGITVDFPCSPFTITLNYKDSVRVFSNAIGKTILFDVMIETEVGSSYNGVIEAIITGTPPPPIPMYIEDKTFVAGEEVTLDIWSDEILNLSGWQFKLKFVEADILELSPGDIFYNVPHNIIEDGKTINTVWFPMDGLPFDVESNLTWFTLTIKPAVDGSTFDLFTTENDPWSSLIIEDEESLIELDVDFSFQIEERNFLVSYENDIIHSEVSYNNPVGDRLIVKGVEPSSVIDMITIYDLNGQKIKTMSINETRASLDIDVSDLITGLYLFQLEINGKSQTHKFFKL